MSTRLNRNKTIDFYKSNGLDLSPILHQVSTPEGTKIYNTKTQDHDLEKALDFKIIRKAHPALFRKEKTVLEPYLSNQALQQLNRPIEELSSSEYTTLKNEQFLNINLR